MRLYLNTSSPTTILKLGRKTYRWQANRDLARHLLAFIHDKLVENHKDWSDLTELRIFTGPGSFTGLRIGATVVNTLSHELKIPIFDQNGQPLAVAIPNYGRPANTTTPHK